MRHVFILGVLTFAFTVNPLEVSAEKETAAPTLTTVKGTLTALNLQGNTFRLENEKGFELQFHWDASTQVLDGEVTSPLSGLAVDDFLEVEYRYNENYERVAQTVRKLQKPETPS